VKWSSEVVCAVSVLMEMVCYLMYEYFGRVSWASELIGDFWILSSALFLLVAVFASVVVLYKLWRNQDGNQRDN